MDCLIFKFSPDSFVLGLIGLAIVFYFVRGFLRIMDKDLNGSD